MVTTWPKNFPGLGSAAENFSRFVDEMSAGRLTVHVYGAGEIVPAFEVFDAVSQGVADAGHGAAYYWKGKIPSSVFFTAVPFGMNAQEMNGWLHYGGGLEVWREAYAPFNIIPWPGAAPVCRWPVGLTGKSTLSMTQGSENAYSGHGRGGVCRGRRHRGTHSGGELYTSLQTGVIDATRVGGAL